MKTLVEMLAERADLYEKGQAILDTAVSAGRTLTDEERSQFDTISKTIGVLNEQIKTKQEYENLTAPMRETPKRVTRDDPNPEETAKAALNQEVKPFSIVRTDPTGRIRIESPRPFQKLKAFDNDNRGYENAYRSGMWVLANLGGNMRAQEWCRVNGVRAAHVEGINTSGGALVPDELGAAIEMIRDARGLFRRNAKIDPMTSDVKTTPRKTGGVTAYFTGEGEEGTESDASWDSIKLVAKKSMILTRISSELSEDAVMNIADDLASDCGYAFADQEDNVGFNGTGVGGATDAGIVGIMVKALDGNHAMANIAATVPHDLLSELDADDLLKVIGRLHPTALAAPGTGWYVSPLAKALVIDAIMIAGGGNTTGNLAAGTGSLPFLGYPVYISTVLPNVATTLDGVAMLAFGNLALAASMGNRRGISIAVDTSVHFTSDMIALRAIERYDINVHSLGSATILSPFVVLIGDAA